MIKHSKVDTFPPSSDPSKIDSAAWNDDHLITKPNDVSAAIGIYVVTGDPNGTLPVISGALAVDRTNGQLWLNIPGTPTWTSFLRSDGGAAEPETAYALLGDSNDLCMGVTTDNAIRWNNVVSSTSKVPSFKAVLNSIYATAVSEPLALVDHGTTDLQAENVSSFPGYGYEMSFGQAMFDLLNGAGTTPTAANKPWLIKFGISGVELKQLLPASSYGTSTPAFGGLNAYSAFKARTLALLATSGRKLGGIVITLGGNDTSNGTDSAAVAANMVTLATQLRADFGDQLAIVWVKLNALANVDTTNRATVRAQMDLGASQIPNCKLIVIDSYPLATDGLHYKANEIWDMGLQAAEAMRRLRGMSARAVAVPTVVGYGTPAFNATTLTPRGYPLSIHGQAEFLVVAAMKNSGSSSAIPTPSGWTSLQTLSQAIGGQTQRAALFMRPLTQTDLDGNNGLPPAVSITPGGDENYAFRFTVAADTTPSIDGSVVATSATSFGTGSVNFGGPTTTGTDDLVVTVVLGQGGGASPAMHYTASNGTTSPALLIEAPMGMDSTNYGLAAVFVGRKSSPGAVGTTVVTPGQLDGSTFTTNPSGFTFAVTQS